MYNSNIAKYSKESFSDKKKQIPTTYVRVYALTEENILIGINTSHSGAPSKKKIQIEWWKFKY